MKKSEIKDLYNQSDSALRMLKAMTLILPYAKGDKAIYKAIDIAACLVNIVKAMCDYMIDDGSTDMTERLQVIKSEATQIESNVAKMGYSKERVALMLNCRAIINNIKDMEEWTANRVEPQHKAPETPQQPIEGNDGELAGNSNETRPDESPDDAGNNEYIELPFALQTDDKRAEIIFKAAENEKWLTIVDNSSAIWHGFVKTKDGCIKNKEISLAYLCHKIYDGCNGLWQPLEEYFDIKELSKHWGYVKNHQRQQWQNDVDKLINKATKTSQ